MELSESFRACYVTFREQTAVFAIKEYAYRELERAGLTGLIELTRCSRDDRRLYWTDVLH